jgi:putative flippase GtrA
LRKFRDELPRYAIGAALAFATDLALLTLLIELLDVQYLLAATISFVAGTLVIYWYSVRHVFRYRRLALPRVELAVFAAIGALGVLVNLGCMYVTVDIVGLHYVPGKVGSAAITFFTNFGLRKLTLFTPLALRSPPAPTAGGTR